MAADEIKLEEFGEAPKGAPHAPTDAAETTNMNGTDQPAAEVTESPATVPAVEEEDLAEIDAPSAEADESDSPADDPFASTGPAADPDAGLAVAPAEDTTAAEEDAGSSQPAHVEGTIVDAELSMQYVSLSQDLDIPAPTAEATDVPINSIENKQDPGNFMAPAASLDIPLPESTARINSDAFFQDDDEPSNNFTLDEDESHPQPSTLQPAAASQDPADLEDEDIQRRLKQTLAAEAADPYRSISPPVHNRPMSPPPGAAPRLQLLPFGVEPEEFRGLLYYDGIDSVGRPVVVVNARADAMLQPKLRNRAMEYMKLRLEPIVYQGPYVLVMVASGHQGDTSSKLPAMWLIRAYRSLSRPYKKNVKFILLVRPSAMLSTMMVMLRPFLSLKAARKLHKVDSLLDIEAATGGDVKAEQLGARFLSEELGVEPGRTLTPPTPPLQRTESLDAEVQLGSF